MKSTQTFLAIALGLVGLAARGTMAATPSKTTTLNIPMATSPSYVACYKSSGSLKKIRSDDGLSKGVCKDICVDEDVSSGGKGYSVMGMTSQFDCWCGNKLPNSADKVSDDKCSIMCPGMGTERCKILASTQRELSPDSLYRW